METDKLLTALASTPLHPAFHTHTKLSVEKRNTNRTKWLLKILRGTHRPHVVCQAPMSQHSPPQRASAQRQMQGTKTDAGLPRASDPACWPVRALSLPAGLGTPIQQENPIQQELGCKAQGSSFWSVAVSGGHRLGLWGLGHTRECVLWKSAGCRAGPHLIQVVQLFLQLSPLLAREGLQAAVGGSTVSHIDVGSPYPKRGRLACSLTGPKDCRLACMSLARAACSKPANHRQHFRSGCTDQTTGNPPRFRRLPRRAHRVLKLSGLPYVVQHVLQLGHGSEKLKNHCW